MINITTFQNALDFLLSLPESTPLPDSCLSEEDGDINLEWYRTPGRVLSVSVGEKGICYAGIDGSDRVSGTFACGNQAPGDMLGFIKQLKP